VQTLLHIHRTGTVRVPLPPAAALPLFTPEGERDWAEGWDPSFPAGEVDDDTAPGTVFVTESGEAQTVWVVADRSASSMRYARVTPGVWGGTVEVCCSEYGTDTVAEVTYDLTALSPGAEPGLQDFADGYEDFMGGWEQAIARALERR
jgi:hypothetical protein